MSVSESSSTTFPQYRLKRKPPPTIDTTEKYPSPDPHDPFAPLWVLRNRTSSALGQNPLVTKDTPSPYSQPPIRTHQGPLMGKADTFKINSALNSIPVERRRSNSYLLPHSTTNVTDAIPPRSSSTVPQTSSRVLRMVHGFNRRPSQSGSTSGDASHPPMKPAHPQVNSEGTLRSNHMSRTNKQRNDPQLVQPRAPGNITRQLTVDTRNPDNSSGNETESDLSIPAPAHRQRVDVKVKSIDVESQGKTNNAGLTTTISFNVGVDVKPALLQRVASNGTTSTGSASLARNVSPPQSMSQQSRLAKFLLPKKTSHDGYMADGEKRSIKPNSRPNQKGPVHKLSISAPLTDTFIHERSKSQQSNDYNTTSSARIPGPSRGGYTSDTDLEEGTGGIRLRGVLFRARKKASTEDTHASATIGPTPESEEMPTPAVVAEKSGYPDDKETERRRAEMSWAEVNIEEYYTPFTNPRASYPTPAPSPKLKPALDLEQEAPLEEEKIRGGKPKKESNGREVEEKKTNSGNGKKGFTMEVKGLEMVGVSVAEALSIDTNPVKAQAPRVRKLKATKTPGSTVLDASGSATTTVVHSPASTSIPPPPPPKILKHRTSSSAPAQAVVEASAASSPNDPSQLPSTHSISNTSIVHVTLISVPKLREPPLQENEDAGAFVKPRRAPRPPATVEGVQSEPEPLKRERFDELWRGKEDKMRSRKDKQDGREIGSTLKIKPKSDDEAQVQKHQNMDAAVKEMKPPEVDAKPSSRQPISVVKHGKAASNDFGMRKDNPFPVGVGRTEGSDGVSKKATVPVSMSTPARLSSKGSGGGCLPRSHHQASRSIFHPKGAASPDNSFNSFGIPLTEYSLPTRTQLSQAACLPVYAEDGRKHLFGSLFEKRKTVVIFIRHFWCPLCQDYMSVVKSTVTPDMIVADGWMKAGDEDEVVWKNEKRHVAELEKIGFVVISNGAHGMIAKYRQIFSLPFQVYTDPSLAIYKLLGMGKTGMDCQNPQHSHPVNYLSDAPAPPMPKKKKHNYSLRKKADTSVSSLSDREREQGGGYVKHGLMSGIAMVVVRAFKVGMPVWEKGGDVGQLGGEFVLGPGLICTYAHKMQTSKGHAPIEEVLEAAGVKFKTPELPPRPSSPQVLDPQLPKPELAQKQTDSIDLSSPPKPAKEARHPQEPVRNRKDSFKGLQEAVSSRSSTIITNATTIKSISHAQSRGPSQRGERERRNDRYPSPIPPTLTNHKSIPPALPPALKAVMTHEEETRWAEERQKSIERAIQDRGNNVRRLGALGRSPSSQGQSGASARSTQGNAGGYTVQAVTAKEGRGNPLMTESRSVPMRSSEDEERIVYKAEGRRVQERTRGSDRGPGSGSVQRVSTSRLGHSATSTFSRR